MNKAIMSFVASAIMAGIVGTASSAHAWIRTVPGASCPRTGGGAPGATVLVECGFPSDNSTGVAGTNVGGNGGVTEIFGDWSGNAPTIQACAIAYSQNAGACGATVNVPQQDVSVPLWQGSVGANNIWDYFWVSFTFAQSGQVVGIAVAGTN